MRREREGESENNKLVPTLISNNKFIYKSKFININFVLKI